MLGGVAVDLILEPSEAGGAAYAACLLPALTTTYPDDLLRRIYRDDPDDRDGRRVARTGTARAIS